MKFILVLLLVVTYKFGQSVPAKQMMNDHHNYGETEKNHLWYRILAGRNGMIKPNNEAELNRKKISMTLNDFAHTNEQILNGGSEDSDTYLKDMEFHEESSSEDYHNDDDDNKQIFVDESANPEPEPTEEVNEATKTESSSANPIQTNCNNNKNFMPPPEDLSDTLLSLWQIIVQLLNFFLCLVMQCICEN